MDQEIDDDPCTDRFWAQLMRFQFVPFLCEMNRSVAAAVAAFFDEVYEENGIPEVCSCKSVNGIKCHENICELFARKICCSEACGEDCANQRFNGDWPGMSEDLQLYPRANFIGVASEKGIPANTFITEFSGVLRKGKPWRDQPYAYPIDTGTEHHFHLDFEKKGNLTRFVAAQEYRKKPNCVVETWWRGRSFKLLLKSGKKDIPPRRVLRIKFPQFTQSWLDKKKTVVNKTHSSADFPEGDREFCIPSFGCNQLHTYMKSTEYSKRLKAIQQSLVQPPFVHKINQQGPRSPDKTPPRTPKKAHKKTPKKTPTNTPNRRKSKKGEYSFSSEQGTPPDPAVARPNAKSSADYVAQYELLHGPGELPEPPELYISEEEEE